MTEGIGTFAMTEMIVNKYNFVFKKKYGQNFLIDRNMLEKIVHIADIHENDTVLEIGPGIGTLTQYLASRAKKVIAVEIDKNLIPILGDTLADFPNVEVYNEDIMKFDVDACFDMEKCREGENEGRFVVVANLPYYITTPVLMKLVEGKTYFHHMLFMVQKEVADRMTAGPGSKDYGALSLAVNYSAEISVEGTVPPECFLPRPKVESALVLFKTHIEPPVKTKDPGLMFRLIRASFNQRRKTLQNGITNFEGLFFSKDSVKEAIDRCGFDASVRGEKLSLEDFARLADELA
ncbi:MAG: 16S rRNA (adenine(1518)-N(6)/adenine(1519)-N(6))-dimethyltransferase RsmA [Lachnospiraceae bacterium]|jgi:16S rRNA (adenine1518-N6/adenine1519-N6)-dimethyltransferase